MASRMDLLEHSLQDVMADASSLAPAEGMTTGNVPQPDVTSTELK